MWRIPYAQMLLTLIPNLFFKHTTYLIYSVIHGLLFFFFISKIGNFDNGNLKAISAFLNLLALIVFPFIGLQLFICYFCLYWIPSLYYMKTYIFTSNATKITNNLFLGNRKAASNEVFLKKENVQCIV